MVIYLQEGLAYRASGLIWIFNDATNVVVMPMVLGAAAQSGQIQGFDAGGFALYYIVSLLLSGFITCHFMWEVAFEIKEGIFSTQLVRPIQYLEFMFVRNFAWRIIRTALFSPLFLIILLAYFPVIQGRSIIFDGLALTAILLGHLLSFMFVMMLSTLALYVQEATSIFELYYVPLLFLSGQMFPIALMPDWVRTLAVSTPFFFTTGFPTEYILGRIDMGTAWSYILIQCGWIAFSFVMYKILFKRGLRHYTGVGM